MMAAVLRFVLRLPGRPSATAALAAALCLVLWTGDAAAHDTWFDLAGRSSSGDLLIAMGTGNVFPVFESPVGAAFLQRRGCRSGGQDAALAPMANGSTSLILRTRLVGTGPASCWAQLQPFEIELPAEIVPVYLEEARPSADVRAAWAAMQARGLPWKERYTKHARILFSADGPDSAASPATAEPQDLGMDMVLLGHGDVLHAGTPATVQVLRDGHPLAGLAVELRHHTDATRPGGGVWLQTDAQGRVQLPLPVAGKWLLRAIDIRRSVTVADTWDSRFATLAFEVAAPAAR